MASDSNLLLLENISVCISLHPGDKLLTVTWKGPSKKMNHRYNIAELIQDFLDHERNLSYYRFNLEACINCEWTCLQEEHHIHSQLEQRLADQQWLQMQLESAQHHLSEDNRFLQQEISLETKKSQDLESRLSASLSFHETLQKVNFNGKYPLDKSGDTNQLLLQNQRQQELIVELQSINETHEAAIKSMQNALHNIMFGAFSCCSKSDSDSSTTVIESSQDTLSSQLLLDMDNVPSDEIKQERTWYEE